MAIWFLLNEAVVLIFFCGISYCEEDLLEELKLKRDDPPELIDFVQTILLQKDEFKKIREAAKRFRIKSDLEESHSDTFNSPAVPQHSFVLKRSPYDINYNARFSPNRPINDIYPYSHSDDENEPDADLNVYEKNNKISQNGEIKMRHHRKRKKMKSSRFRRGLDVNDYSSGHDFGSSNIKINPRSEFGVRNVPGNKFGWSKLQNTGINADKSKALVNFKTNHEGKHNSPRKNHLVSENKFLPGKGDREKRLVAVEIIDDNNVIKSINLGDGAQPVRLSVKNRYTENSFMPSKRPFVITGKYSNHPFNNNKIAGPNRQFVALLNAKTARKSPNDKLHKNKVKSQSDENNAVIMYPNKDTAANDKMNIYSIDPRQQKVIKITLQDVDQPTSAIEQHKLSTKPYVTSQPSTDTAILSPILDFQAPLAAILFATNSVIEPATTKQPNTQNLKKVDGLFPNMNHINNLLHKQNFGNNMIIPPNTKYKINQYIVPFDSLRSHKFNYLRRDFDGSDYLEDNQPLEKFSIINKNNRHFRRNRFFGRRKAKNYYNQKHHIWPYDTHRSNNQRFQSRKLQFLYDATETNEIISKDIPEKDTRYGYLDYENGQHNNRIGIIENKIRVKRVLPNLFGVDDDEEYSEDLVNDYKQSLKQARSEDEYEEEEDPVVLKKVTYENVKNAKNNSIKDKQTLENTSKDDTAHVADCIQHKNITGQSDDTVKTIAALHNNENAATEDETLSKERSGRDNECNCKNNKNLNGGCVNCKECKNCKEAGANGNHIDVKNYKTCKNCHQKENIVHKKQREDNFIYDYQESFSDKPKNCHGLKDAFVGAQKNKKKENMGDEEDEDSNDTEKYTDKNYHTKIVINSQMTPLPQETPKQEAPFEEAQFQFKKFGNTTEDIEIPTEEATETSETTKSTKTTKTTKTCKTTKPSTTTTTSKTTTTTKKTTTTTTCETTTTSSDDQQSMNKIRRKLIAAEKSKNKIFKNNYAIQNQNNQKKIETKISAFKDDKNHANVNHKEDNGYFHHPTKTKNPLDKEIGTESATKAFSSKSHLQDIFTRYHKKHNLNDFKGFSYLNAEESTDIPNGASQFMDKLRRSKEQTKRRLQLHKNKNYSSSSSNAREVKNDKIKTKSIQKVLKRHGKAERKTAKTLNHDYGDESYAEFSLHVDKIRNNGNLTSDENKELLPQFSINFQNDYLDSITGKTSMEETRISPSEKIEGRKSELNQEANKETKSILLDTVESFADVVEDDTSAKRISKRHSNRYPRNFADHYHHQLRNSDIMYAQSKNLFRPRHRRYITKSWKNSEPGELFEKTRVYNIPYYSQTGENEQYDFEDKRKLAKNRRGYNINRISRTGQSTNEKECKANNTKGMKQWINPQKDKGKCLLGMNKAKCSKKVSCQQDSAQMHDALNGHLASIIVETIFERVKNHPQLHNRFSQGLHRTHNFKSEIKDLDDFRNNETEKDIKHTEEMLHEIMTVLNRIIMDQVTRRTCRRLSPELQNYLEILVSGVNATSEDEEGEESYPLPSVNSTKGQKSIKPRQGTFLFNNQDTRSDADKAEEDIRKRIRMVRELLAKYRNMSAQCRIKVRDVEAYLRKHLGLLQNMLQAVEKDREAADAEKRTRRKHMDLSVGSNFKANFKRFPTATSINKNLDLTAEKSDEEARRKLERYQNKLEKRNYNNGFVVASEELTDKQLKTPDLTPDGENAQSVKLDQLLFDNYQKPQRSIEQQNLQSYYNYRNDADLLDTYGENEKKSKPAQKREASRNDESMNEWDVSGQYKKLAQTADHLRKKKQIEERLGKLFGNTKKRATKHENYVTIKTKNRKAPDLSKIAFEKPVVFQLDK